MTAADQCFDAAQEMRRQSFTVTEGMREIAEHVGGIPPHITESGSAYAYLFGAVSEHYKRTLALLMFAEAELRGFTIHKLAKLKTDLGITSDRYGMTLAEVSKMLDAVREVRRG